VGIGIAGFYWRDFIRLQLLHVQVLDQIRWVEAVSYLFEALGKKGEEMRTELHGAGKLASRKED
jgi:hypothetical protein